MTVRETIQRASASLTASERKIANAVLADYPFSALHTIQELAEKTGVSAASITRFVSKIGCSGYQEFQRQLIGELREGGRSPLDLKATEKLSDGDFVADYARRAATLLTNMGRYVSHEQFNSIVKLLADPNRVVFLLGGRISDSIARLLTQHLRQIRPRVRHLPQNHEDWPDYIISMRKQDVVVLFDFRRYQADVARLAERITVMRHLTIILITDKWMSPVARYADEVVALPIENDTAWDTFICAVAFIEALFVKVSEANWHATKGRIATWDTLRLSPPAMKSGGGDEA